jgi:pyrroloquinoline-quinone synthase
LTKCSACGEVFAVGDYHSLASHYYSEAQERSDASHVMWLNRYVTNAKSANAEELSDKLRNLFMLPEDGRLQKWIRKSFVDRFFTKEKPHPFVIALQHPSRSTLLGYVLEHQHFLRQWVRSCSYIMAKTDKEDATLYELENINTEYGGYGPDRPSHYELLLRMGESLGLKRNEILSTSPLPDTKYALNGWNDLAKHEHWVETMAAMHGLELIADRTLRDSDGAAMNYFDPSILKSGEVNDATKNFLREGFEADVGHSKEALDLVDKYAEEFDIVENVQATFLRSIDLFHTYLLARLQRAEMIENSA